MAEDDELARCRFFGTGWMGMGMGVGIEAPGGGQLRL